jgi:hypothetical protein
VGHFAITTKHQRAAIVVPLYPSSTHPKKKKKKKKKKRWGGGRGCAETNVYAAVGEDPGIYIPPPVEESCRTEREGGREREREENVGRKNKKQQ